MVERIRVLLQSRQLTPTQFADAIGVARPIVSHILSGRNKPSLEVVQKIIGAFPDLSLPWLLSGVEPMTAVSVPPGNTSPATPASQPAQVPEAVEAPVKRIRTVAPKASATPDSTVSSSAPAVEPLLLPEPAATPVTASQAMAATQPVPTASFSQSPEASQKNTAASAMPLAAFAEPGKKIRRIVIFYQDGTFSDYQPE